MELVGCHLGLSAFTCPRRSDQNEYHPIIVHWYLTSRQPRELHPSCATLDPATLHQAFVVSHQEVRFDLL